MANVKNEKIKEIRNAIKTKYPTKDGWKFSIRNMNHMSINVSILRGPIDFFNWQNKDNKIVYRNGSHINH